MIWSDSLSAHIWSSPWNHLHLWSPAVKWNLPADSHVEVSLWTWMNTCQVRSLGWRICKEWFRYRGAYSSFCSSRLPSSSCFWSWSFPFLWPLRSNSEHSLFECWLRDEHFLKFPHPGNKWSCLFPNRSIHSQMGALVNAIESTILYVM